MINFFKKNQGFTLIELIVSITILSIIMLSIFIIYSNIIDANKKLELSRILQENSRNITETLAKWIREKGIDYSFYSNLTEKIDYSTWNTILALKSWDKFCLMKQDNDYCDSTCNSSNINCSLWILGTHERINTSDVVVNNLRFYISGEWSDNITNLENPSKVTLVFDLSVRPWKWLKSEIAKNTTIKIQTTINEKIYKNNQ